jgi:DNA-binding response OmpR family regulator
MSMAKRILSVALHPTLAETRSLLIRSLGSEVQTVSSLTQLREACQTHSYDLLLISQGISINEKLRIAAEFREHCKGTPILEMFDISPDLPDAEFKFHAAEGPAALVSQLKTILE